MKLKYFSWIRERIGKGEEDIELPPEVITIADLITWQKQRGEEYVAAFAHEKIVRVALDQEHVDDRSSALGDVREIAFFPPMTGG